MLRVHVLLEAAHFSLKMTILGKLHCIVLCWESWCDELYILFFLKYLIVSISASLWSAVPFLLTFLPSTCFYNVATRIFFGFCTSPTPFY